MSLRTKSRGAQWGCWAILFLVGLAAYVVGLSLIGSETSAWLILARQNVAVFAAVSFVFGHLAYELRWDGVVRRVEVEVEVEVEGKVERRGEGEGEGRGGGGGGGGGVTTPTPAPAPTPTPTPSPGEAEWIAARQLPHAHRPKRSNERDLAYLTRVKQAADLGFALAQAKLGDYARDRQVFAEAYYWYFCARKQGMRNLDGRLRGICLDWKRAGCPSEKDWFMLSDDESREIARALLNRDAGRNVKSAADFLASVGSQWTRGI